MLINGTSSNYNSYLQFLLNCKYSASSSFKDPELYLNGSFDKVAGGVSWVLDQMKTYDDNPCSLSCKMESTILRIKNGVFRSRWPIVNSLNAVDSEFTIKDGSSLNLECSSRMVNVNNYSEEGFAVLGNHFIGLLQRQFKFIDNECFYNILEIQERLPKTPPRDFFSSYSLKFNVAAPLACIVSVLGLAILGVTAFQYIKLHREEMQAIRLLHNSSNNRNDVSYKNLEAANL